MQRSLYPDSVEVDNTQLEYTESTKINELLERSLISDQPGVISGLQISIDGTNNQTFDVLAGQVMVLNGELAVVASNIFGVALADNTSGIVNYAIVTYTETEANPEPSENGVNVYDTIVTSAGIVGCITRTAYEALTTTEQGVIAVIGIITATGGAIAAITQSDAFNVVLSPSQPVNIIGVSIIGISVGTSTGIGTLFFNAPPATSPNPTILAPRIQWTAPGDTPGAFVNISDSGNYTLISNNGDTLTISVISAVLPVINETDNITIVNLYTQTVDRYTPNDYLHRSFIGTGTPSPTNPHGLSFDDLGGLPTEQIDQHQLLMHDNGIRRGSSSTCLEATVTVVDPGIDYITITSPVTGDIFYVNGIELQALTTSTISFSVGATTTFAMYDISVDATGTPHSTLRVTHPATPNVTGVVVIDISDSIAIGTHTLTYSHTNGSLQWDSGVPILIRGNGNYILYDNLGNPVTVNVGVSQNLGYGELPNTNGADTITVLSPPNRKTNFQLANTPWNGSAQLGWELNNSGPLLCTDKRYFGTMGLPELRTDAINLIEDNESATYTVGDGIATFGDYNGASGIQTAINVMMAASISGTILVYAGTYDPFSIGTPDIKIRGSGGTVIDGISSTVTPGAVITVNASNALLMSLTMQNAGIGITQQSGNNGHGVDLLFSSTLSAKLSYVAGNNNKYTDATSRNYRASVGSVVLNPLDEIVTIDASSGPATVTFPPLSACVGEVIIKKIDATANAVTLAPAGSDNMDYQSSISPTLPGTDVYLDAIRIVPLQGVSWITT